jgi:hypothetical protein
MTTQTALAEQSRSRAARPEAKAESTRTVGRTRSPSFTTLLSLAEYLKVHELRVGMWWRTRPAKSPSISLLGREVLNA